MMYFVPSKRKEPNRDGIEGYCSILLMVGEHWDLTTQQPWAFHAATRVKFNGDMVNKRRHTRKDKYCVTFMRFLELSNP